MSVFSRIVVGGAGLAALLFALDVVFATSDNAAPAMRPISLTAVDWPHVEPDAAPAVRWHARDAAPAVRIREAFAQFMPGEGRARTRSTSL